MNKDEYCRFLIWKSYIKFIIVKVWLIMKKLENIC